MHPFRRLSLPAHGALELLVGVAILATPFVLGFGAAGTIAAVIAGALVVGLGLGAVEAFSVATHLAYDQLASVALAAAAIGVAVAGEAAAALVLLGAAVALLALSLATRYSRGFPAG